MVLSPLVSDPVMVFELDLPLTPLSDMVVYPSPPSPSLPPSSEGFPPSRVTLPSSLLLMSNIIRFLPRGLSFPPLLFFFPPLIIFLPPSPPLSGSVPRYLFPQIFTPLSLVSSSPLSAYSRLCSTVTGSSEGDNPL